MSGNKETAEEIEVEKTRRFNRRSVLKLAGAGLGTSVGTKALGNQLVMPARAASGAVFEDFDYGSSADMKNYYHFGTGKSLASLDTVGSTATSDASSSVLKISGGTSKMIAYDDNDGYDLQAYPKVGDTITCWLRGANATENMNVIYGAVDGAGRDDYYYVKMNMENSLLGMGMVVDGTATWLTTAPKIHRSRRIHGTS